jgi:hypothetical protein
MTCSQYQELLSNYIDGSLDLGEQTKVEHHLAGCDICRAARDDLLQIVVFSRHLPNHDPSPSVWGRIRTEIEREPRPTVRTLWARVAHWYHPPLRFAAAAAVLIALVSSALILFHPGRQPNMGLMASEGSISAGHDQSPEPVGPSIRDLENRISVLNADLESRRQNWDQALRTAFDRDMLYVDETLARCHHELNHNPGDEVCRDMMLGAYREKVRLLEGFTDF